VHCAIASAERVGTGAIAAESEKRDRICPTFDGARRDYSRKLFEVISVAGSSLSFLRETFRESIASLARDLVGAARGGDCIRKAGEMPIWTSASDQRCLVAPDKTQGRPKGGKERKTSTKARLRRGFSRELP